MKHSLAYIKEQKKEISKDYMEVSRAIKYLTEHQAHLDYRWDKWDRKEIESSKAGE